MSKLVYRKWADNRNEALPIGNGRIGAMVYGHPYTDILALNEETLWSGSPEPPVVPYDPAVIAHGRQLLDGQHCQEAEDFLDRNLLRGIRTQTYMPLGKLSFQLNHQRLLEVTDYQRELDLSQAVHCTNMQILCRKDSTTTALHTVQIRRECFVSLADDVLVYHFESDKPLSANVVLDSALQASVSYDASGIHASGRCPTVFNEYNRDNLLPTDPKKESVPFAVQVGFLEGSYTRGEGTSVFAYAKNTFTAIVSISTGFNGYDKPPISQGKDYRALCQAKLNAACKYSYEALRARHIEKYTEQYSRTEISIDGPERSDLPTDERIRRVRAGEEDPGLVTMLFDYGKYLTISASQPGGQPTNLQGIWCEDQLAPWNSNYTLNINTQMNYWATETMDLPECHLPLMDMIRELSQRENPYGMRGWCAAHNTDIWRFNRMATRYSRYGLWDMGGVWLARHIYDHFIHTGDMDFLRENMDILRGIYDFLEDRLSEDAQGHLHVSPSTSPETTYQWDGARCSVTGYAAMDQQIIEDYLLYMGELETLLGCSREKYDRMRLKLAPLQIGPDGNLLEYGEGFSETDETHQHLSHLYGLYPGSTIHPDTPMGDAARKALELRFAKGYGNGWANIWAGLCFTQFKDGIQAYERIRFMLCNTVYPNLLNICPPFQIDGNYGVCALICRMLLQGNSNSPVFLPAIPPQWQSGFVRGLKLPGGKKISFTWKEGKVTHWTAE